MEPNSEPPNTSSTNTEPVNPSTDPKVLYPNDVLANSGLTDKLGGVMQNPQVSRYLGKATKIVAACAISGCILLVIAILAVVNLFNQITSQIPQ
ncbi:MAG: hypothetical protein Q8T09_04900 [Candidatus Melainabacteria bacterium]|nr:hypothetical protein [Candidatus Melainabacteria bacterium]